MTYQQFEREVAARYFAGPHATGTPFKGCQTLLEAANKAWVEVPLSQEEVVVFQERIGRDLAGGALTYVVVAQRFTASMQTTVQYLNAMIQDARFCLVEMVRFVCDGTDAFEARTVLKPEPSKGSKVSAAALTRDALVAQIADGDYLEAVLRLIDAAEGMGLNVYWGTTGLSIRVVGQQKGTVASVAWFFPPGVSGWMGLTNLVLGFDPQAPAADPLTSYLDIYLTAVEGLPGSTPQSKGGLNAYAFEPDTVDINVDAIIAAWEELVAAVNGTAGENH